MPYKFYHGRTGRVWNVTPRAIGVVVNKKIGNRLIPKRLHVRLEHVKKCPPPPPTATLSSPATPITRLLTPPPHPQINLARGPS